MAALGRICYACVEIILSLVSLIFFLTIILPIFSILYILFYLWRLLLISYIRFGNDYVRVMDGKNPVVAIDDMYRKPLCTIVGMGSFDGKLDYESAVTFVNNMVCAKDVKSNKLVNPEFHQYYEEWMGFIWWKWEKNFNIREHVKLFDSSKFQNGIAEEDDVVNIIHMLEQLPFAKGKSPWDVIVLQNINLKDVQDPQHLMTGIIFRFHHGLSDGVAMMQMFMKYGFDDLFEKVVHPVYIERNRWQKRFYKILAALQLPYEFLKQGITAYDINDWHLSESKLKREVSKAWSKRIPIENIRKFKKQNEVGFTAALISAVSGALRKSMLANGVNVPKKIHAILPLPWPKHPKKLCNHWSYGFMTLPVGTENAQKRLLKCNKYVNELKESITPAVNFVILTIFNLLPTWVIRKTTLTNYFPTVILSNFPGPPPGTTGIGGWALVDTCFTGGPLRGNIGISITILSYDGYLRIVLGVDRAIFLKDEMTKHLIHLIEKELEFLENVESENSSRLNDIV